MIRKLVVLLVVILLLAVFAGSTVYLIRQRQKPRRETPGKVALRVQAPPVTVLPTHDVEIMGYGSAQPRVKLEIAPRVSGQIVYRSEDFHTGKYVLGPEAEDGPEVLFRLDTEPFELAVEKARQSVASLQAQLDLLDANEANLEENRKLQSQIVVLQEKQLQRSEELYRRNVGTENEVENAQSALLSTRVQLQTILNELRTIPVRRKELQVQLASAKVQLEEAELNLGYATYEAPITGRIIQAAVEKGEQITIGEPCGEMYGTRRMEIPVSIPASDLQWIDESALQACKEARAAGAAPLTPARVEWSKSGTDRVVTWQGSLERIEAGLEASTRTARLVVCVDNHAQDNPDQPNLDINMYCRVYIRGRTVSNVIMIPRNAVQPGGSVYVAAPADDAPSNYRLAVRKVEVLRYTNGHAMIRGGVGVSDGDRVIVSAVNKPVDGMAVEPMDLRNSKDSSDGADTTRHEPAESPAEGPAASQRS